MEYYSFLLKKILRSDENDKIRKVSVSLWSIIHSYIIWAIIVQWFLNSFRLLMEYYSFLSYGQKSLLLQYIFRVLS